MSELAEHEENLSYDERRHREQLEYAEDEDPEPVVEHRLEADVAIPNIPVPRGSDGNVSEPCTQPWILFLLSSSSLPSVLPFTNLTPLIPGSYNS